MPFYEYLCGNGHVTEELRPIKERDDVRTCSVCATNGKEIGISGYAHPILSATPTTFVAAGGRKL